jgi:hypothetical protein
MRKTLLLVSVILPLVWCANAKDRRPKDDPAKSAEADAAETAAVVAPSSSKGGTNNIIDPDTRDLKPRDILRYSVDQDPQRSTEASLVSITDVYDAHFPVSRGFEKVVTINVRGKHLPDIRTELKSKLEEDFYTTATIALDLVSVNRGSGADMSGSTPKAIFFGEIRGAVPLPEGEKKTVSEAVLLLGYTDYADLKHIKINRKDPATGKPTTIKVNVSEIIKDNKIDKDVELLDGDRVEVPARKIIGF